MTETNHNNAHNEHNQHTNYHTQEDKNKKLNKNTKKTDINNADTQSINEQEHYKPHANLSVKIRSIITWSILVLSIPIYNVIAYASYLLPKHTRHTIVTSWGHLFLFLAKHICKTEYKVLGLENINLAPVIFASNHQSTWETMALNCILPRHVSIVKKELLNIPLFGWAFRTISPIAIDRNSPKAASKQIIDQGLLRIKDGYNILLYPEGTRIPVHVKESVFKNGVGRLAVALQLPVIPIAHNAGYVMPRRSFWIYPGMVTIRIGKALFLNPDDDFETFTIRIYEAVRAQYLLINQS